MCVCTSAIGFANSLPSESSCLFVYYGRYFTLRWFGYDESVAYALQSSAVCTYDYKLYQSYNLTFFTTKISCPEKNLLATRSYNETNERK